MTKVVDDRWVHDLDPGPSVDHETALAQFHTVHQVEMVRLQALDDARLQQPLADLDGRPQKAWVFLMMMVEHEIHHRSQLDCYLAEAGVEPPAALRCQDGRRAREDRSEVLTPPPGSGPTFLLEYPEDTASPRDERRSGLEDAGRERQRSTQPQHGRPPLDPVTGPGRAEEVDGEAPTPRRS